MLLYTAHGARTSRLLSTALSQENRVAVWVSRKSELHQGHLGRKGLLGAGPKPALIVIHRCRVQSAEAEVRGSH